MRKRGVVNKLSIVCTAAFIALMLSMPGTGSAAAIAPYISGGSEKAVAVESGAPLPPLPLLPAGGATVYTLSPTLRWQADMEAESFRIQVALDYQFTKILIDENSIPDPYYLAQELERSTAYFWRVSARNSSGISSDWSPFLQFRTASILLPVTPRNLIATLVERGRIDISWEDTSDNEINFKVERRTRSSPYFIVTTLSSNANRYSDTGLIADTSYLYRIRAYNSAGYSGYSNEAMALTLPPPLPSPRHLAPFSSSNVESLTPCLQWQRLNTTARYGIQISADNSFSSIINFSTVLTEPKYTVEEGDLKENSSYYWRVRCHSYNGVISDWSKPWHFTTYPKSAGSFSCGCGR